jgi:NAD+ synthase (glutamine-hydrolysing)
VRVALAQIPNIVGDITGNTKRIGEVMDWAEGEGADVLVLPELALTGYPTGDLALHREFVADVEAANAGLAARSGTTTTVLGTITRVPPRRSWDSVDRSVAISATLLTNGEHRGTYHKVLLPTREVFDEGRTFAPGDQPGQVWALGDTTVGVCICEDAWSVDGPPEAQARNGAQILLIPNASPYERGKHQRRREHQATVARRNGVPIVYVNLVGGQDDLVFDGRSMVVGADGTLLHEAAAFDEDRLVVDVDLAPRRPAGSSRTVHGRPLTPRAPSPATAGPATISEADELADVWRAIVTGTRDFARRNSFTRAILGLSGGIDAAITAAVAADAFGPERVLGIAMPGPNAPDHELLDAREVAESLGIRFDVVPLEPILNGMAAALAADPPELLPDDFTGEDLEGIESVDVEEITAEEAISDEVRDVEHRARAVVLTAISDDRGHLVLATGNKTELSIGGATVHGDMVGGFAPLKDCPKTLLYRLARHRGAAGHGIPPSVMAKQPSATWDIRARRPPFAVLDAIVERYVQYGDGVEELILAGYDPAVVVDTLRRIDEAEIARRQIPPGVKISPRAFGTDRRMPISQSWRAHRRADVTATTEPRPPLGGISEGQPPVTLPNQ